MRKLKINIQRSYIGNIYKLARGEANFKFSTYFSLFKSVHGGVCPGDPLL